VEHHHRLVGQLHGVEDGGVTLELRDRRGDHVRVLRVQHGVLAGVEGEPHVELAGQRADAGELVAALVHLPMELAQLGVARVRGERARHAVHADPEAVAVVEDRPQAPERDSEVGLGLPAPCVVRGQPSVAEHLDREAESVAAHAHRLLEPTLVDRFRHEASYVGDGPCDHLAYPRRDEVERRPREREGGRSRGGG
jgi:hypothetical protein